jgi:hypothetical protein
MVLFAVMPATAQAEVGEPSSTLLLTVAAPVGEAERLEVVTRELLKGLEVQVELRRVERISFAEMRHPPAPEQRYFARVWISETPSGGARLYLEHGASDRVLVREVAGETNNPELVREELAHILQAAVEGIKAGQEVGAPRSDALKEVSAEDTSVEPPRDLPAAAPARPVERKPPQRAPLLRFGPRYEVVWLGDGARFEDGPGAALEAALPIGFELAGYYRRPLRVDDVPVGVRLQTLSLRALVTAQVWQTERSAIRLGAGAGADLVRVNPVAAPERSVELSDRAWLKLAMGRLAASYGHRVLGFVELQLALALDVDFGHTRYVFQQSSGPSTVLDPWPVRPALSLGAAVP